MEPLRPTPSNEELLGAGSVAYHRGLGDAQNSLVAVLISVHSERRGVTVVQNGATCSNGGSNPLRSHLVRHVQPR